MITNYKDLIALKGKTIFIVLSPKVEHTGEDIGNCKLYEWVVGDTHDNQWLDDAINDDRYLSLKDIGIIENDYNNHAASEQKKRQIPISKTGKQLFGTTQHRRII